MNIIVLYGGESAERAVSLRSGAAVAAALRACGHTVSCSDWRGAPPDARFTARLRAADAIFLALHGGVGEDGTLQGMLEARGIRHYTGSPPVGAARAMNKAVARARVSAAGVPVANGVLWRVGERPPRLSFPFVSKPLCGGSSVGFRIFQSERDLAGYVPAETMLCEEYLGGKEFTVGILGDTVLPVIQIEPAGGVYDYAHKYTMGAAHELCPAPLRPAETCALQQAALTAFRALGLRDVGRVDFKSDGRGRVCFLEANALPGMTATSLLPLAARAAGFSMPALCERIAVLAAARRTRPFAMRT